MSSQCSSSTLPYTQTTHRALELTDILEEIFSHVQTPHELLQYRSVCHKWNDVIVHTLNAKWKNCFPLRLRFGPQVPLSLLQSEAETCSREILESPVMTLTGTTIPLPFDTVVIDQDFYLAGINPEWQHFLAIYGESIRHLKFKIRSGERRENNSHQVTDCAQVVSRENLRAAFSAMPNLESLDLSIRFSHYGTNEPLGVSQRMFPEGLQVTDLPQLKKLTKITIQEPHGIHYSTAPYLFWYEILRMAPNLTTLNLKWSKYLSRITSVLSALPHLDNSLTSLGITMSDRNTRFPEFIIHESNFFRFHLTKLELSGISGNQGEGIHLETFLQSQSSTLTTLILGDRFERPHRCRPLYPNPLSLPPIMGSLKILELNLFKYNIASLTSYPKRFPALEELTFSNCETGLGCMWRWDQLLHLLPGEPSYTVKKFSLLGQVRGGDRNTISHAVRFTFPLAEYHFGL